MLILTLLAALLIGVAIGHWLLGLFDRDPLVPRTPAAPLPDYARIRELEREVYGHPLTPGEDDHTATAALVYSVRDRVELGLGQAMNAFSAAEQPTAEVEHGRMIDDLLAEMRAQNALETA